MPIEVIGLGAWGCLLLGAWLTAYAIIKWRRAAKACYPMPFHRRTGYLTGTLFGSLIMVTPLVIVQYGGSGVF